MRYKLPRPKKLLITEDVGLLEDAIKSHGVVLGGDWDLGDDPKKILADLLQLGTVHHFRGEDEKAIEVLEEVLARGGKPAAAQYLAVSYERLGRYEEAIATHRRFLDRDPTSSFHLAHLGRLLCLVGREVEAEKALTAARKVAPYDFHVRARLASVRSRMRPDTFNEAVNRPVYSIIVLLGERSNFSVYQNVLEELYRRTHRLILVADADSRDVDGQGLALKAWLKRHPGVEFTDHAEKHRARVGWLSWLAGRPYTISPKRPWLVPLSDDFRGWTLKMAADLLLVCVDRSDAYFVEPYVRAAQDAGLLICGLSDSGTKTHLERFLTPSTPRLRCVLGQVPAERVDVSRAGNSITIYGDLILEPVCRPRPEKTDVKLFDGVFPTLRAGEYVLYLGDPGSNPIQELQRVGSLAGRFRASRPAARTRQVVYRPAFPTSMPTHHPMPDNLVLWPLPTSSRDSNTAAILRVGIQRAAAVVSSAGSQAAAGVLSDRPAIVLRTDGMSAQVQTPYEAGIYRCDSLGEAVSLVDEIQNGRDPLATVRRVLAEAADPSLYSPFGSVGAMAARGIELLAGGETLERASKLLISELDRLSRRAAEAADDPRAVTKGQRWAEAADRALVAAGSELRVAPECRNSTGWFRHSMSVALSGAAELVLGLERSRLIDQLVGPSSRGLVAQILGGSDFPEEQLQSALLLKAISPEATVYLVDFDGRFEQIDRAIRQVLPDARIANAVGGKIQGKARLFDFVYMLDKHVGRFGGSYVPTVAVAQSDLCLVPPERLLLLASRLQDWSVSYLMVSIDTEHPWSVRSPKLSTTLRRTFRISEVNPEAGSRYQTVVGVSQSTVAGMQWGAVGAESLPSCLKRPSVSIGLVVYNGGDNLRDAIKSILNQTYWDFELIIVDNGSTDATLEIARTYAERDSRIIIYPRGKNVGAVGNFRFSLSLATGIYFCWASDHDMYDRVWLERMIHALDERPAAVLAYPYFGMIDDKGARVGDHLVRFETTGRDVAHRMRLVTDQMRGSGSKVYGLYRRAALDHVRVRTTVWWDRLFLLELAAVGEFVQVNEVLWWRRYKGVLRKQIEAPEAGKFGSIPPSLSTKDTVIRQLKISFEDGRVPFFMRMPTLANAALLVFDLVFSRPGRTGIDLTMLPLALRSAIRAVVRTKSFVPAEFRALREYLFRW